MEFQVAFSGGAKVDVAFGAYVVRTDQPPSGGGEGSAPTPFHLFLASIATCAGIYVLRFLQQRQIPTDGLSLVQRAEYNQATGMVEKVEIVIGVPAGFPEKYLPALIRSAEQCSVKKHIQQPPVFLVSTRTDGQG